MQPALIWLIPLSSTLAFDLVRNADEAAHVQGLAAICKPHISPVDLTVLWIQNFAALVLLVLFLLQSRGTASVGRLFGPVMLDWFVTLGLLGLVQLVDVVRLNGGMPRQTDRSAFSVVEDLAVTPGTVVFRD